MRNKKTIKEFRAFYIMASSVYAKSSRKRKSGVIVQFNKKHGRPSSEHPAAVQARYIVRRLTPTEFARLQGFPSWWGIVNPVENLTDEDYAFWLNVRNTYAEINGKATKEYTKQQMLSWYNKLHSDSAEYKMWGNGIALPNALYVMQGIAEVVGVHHSK